MENKDKQTEQQDLLDTAKDLFKQAESGWRDIRTAAVDDLSFFHGKQWDDQLINIARLKKEPTLQVNRLPQFVKQIENELRQREMAITVAASDEQGSEETANIFTSIIRGIEARSNAKVHYIHAAGENGAMVPGIGYLKVELDYTDNQGFNQDIWIKSVKDPMKIICDPNVQEPDFSDAEFWFEFEDYPEKTFKKLFPGAECSSSDMFPIGSRGTSWLGDGTIRVARFWYKEYTSVTSYLFDDGTVALEEKVESITDEDDNRYGMVDGLRKIILRERTVTNSTIKWMDFTGAEVLSEGIWPINKFPFAAVTGPMSIIDGKRDIRGMIRFARDSQKMLNYMASSAARRIASANKSPWLVDMKSIKPYEQVWRRANVDGVPYLPYDSYDANGGGRTIPPPSRADQTGQIQDLLMAAQKFENDLKATIGIYDAGLGATPNEQSGVAIKTLAQQGQNANFHFSDNLVTALKRIGEILIELIPIVYDTPRIVKTISVDGQSKLVRINQIVESKGKLVEYNIRDATGHYGVTINVGPAYATQKQAAIEQMTELLRINPNIAPFVQDIIVGNMDFEGKDNVKNRLMKVLEMQTPGIIENSEQADIPPQALAQMQQQQLAIQQLTEQLQQLSVQNQQLNNVLQNKQIEYQNAIQKARVDAQLAAGLQQQKHANALEIEQARAIREDAIRETQMQMEHVKAQIGHTEKMMSVVMEAMKLFGVNAGSVVEQVVPTVDAAIDTAAMTNNVNINPEGV